MLYMSCQDAAGGLRSLVNDPMCLNTKRDWTWMDGLINDEQLPTDVKLS